MRSTTNPQIPASKFILIHFWTLPVCSVPFCSALLPCSFFSFLFLVLALPISWAQLPLLNVLWALCVLRPVRPHLTLTLGDIEMSTLGKYADGQGTRWGSAPKNELNTKNRSRHCYQMYFYALLIFMTTAEQRLFGQLISELGNWPVAPMAIMLTPAVGIVLRGLRLGLLKIKQITATDGIVYPNAVVDLSPPSSLATLF